MKIDILEKIDILTNTNANLNEMTDDENPRFMFTATNTKLLVKIASGKINAQEYAKMEMTNRGFGKKGEWIGFDEAKNLWKPKVK